MKSPLAPSPALHIVEQLSTKAKHDFLAGYKRASKDPNVDLAIWLIEHSDIETLRKLIDNWIEAFKSESEDRFAQGICTAFIEFDAYLLRVKEISDAFWEGQ